MLPLRPRKIRDSRHGSSSINPTNLRCSASALVRPRSFSRCYPRPHYPRVRQQARYKRHCSASPRRRIMCRD
ncbi:hypothetical protein BGY98DRAFT_1064857 [Russula aff. rugulosa BPL654]|nr:hypothetical protein BGY98DRAFT_1064857 [Russula aff. rugulosa BPL654]